MDTLTNVRLLGAKRTSRGRVAMSGNDPKRTLEIAMRGYDFRKGQVKADMQIRSWHVPFFGPKQPLRPQLDLHRHTDEFCQIARADPLHDPGTMVLDGL